MATRKWVVRDVPLNEEELACWNEQAQWLICPVTYVPPPLVSLVSLLTRSIFSGKKWGDKNTILGVGIYHAPRFLSKIEEQRKLDEEAAATQARAKITGREGLTSSSGGTSLKASTDGKATATPTATSGVTSTTAVPAPTSVTPTPTTTTVTDTAAAASASASVTAVASSAARQSLKVSTGGSAAAVEWAKDFEPYPSVQPPPKANLEQLGMLDEDVPLGNMQVIIGPAFDIDAFNDGVDGNKEKGILSQEARGILSMDQQVRACTHTHHLLTRRVL